MIVVSSTPCGLTVVLVMVVAMVIGLHGHVEANPLVVPVVCGLSLVVYMKVHTGFKVFVAYNLLLHPPVVLWAVVWTLSFA